jgi:pyruvate/2-oxoglutarate dehydrogenase complex dihydrolipoamide acyltransferase (E2) component
MRVNIIIPQQGNTIETVYINKWLRTVGDTVSKGEPLLETETDKAVLQVESPADGTLAGIVSAKGTEVPVLSVVGWIEIST